MTKILKHSFARILFEVRANQAFTGTFDFHFALIPFPQTDPARLLPDYISSKSQ
jgi:hypothetical protein